MSAGLPHPAPCAPAASSPTPSFPSPLFLGASHLFSLGRLRGYATTRQTRPALALAGDDRSLGGSNTVALCSDPLLRVPVDIGEYRSLIGGLRCDGYEPHKISDIIAKVLTFAFVIIDDHDEGT